MRSKITGLCALALSLGAMHTASAADMPAKAPVYKAPMMAPAYNWSGWYAGVNAGFGWQTNDAVAFSPANAATVVYFTGGAVPGSVSTGNSGGGLFGGQIGYNWQWTPNWVAGIEADLDWAGLKGSGAVNTAAGGFSAFTTTAERKLTAFGSLRARFGYAFDSTLLYATGGLAFADTTLNTSVNTPVTGCGPAGVCATASSSQWRVGWTAGGGVEWAFMQAWRLKAEYLYYDLGSRSQNQFDPLDIPPAPVFTSSAKFSGSIVRAGLNYKFN